MHHQKKLHFIAVGFNIVCDLWATLLFLFTLFFPFFFFFKLHVIFDMSSISSLSMVPGILLVRKLHFKNLCSKLEEKYQPADQSIHLRGRSVGKECNILFCFQLWAWASTKSLLSAIKRERKGWMERSENICCLQLLPGQHPCLGKLVEL